MSKKPKRINQYKIDNELFLPAEYGYGSAKLPDIPAYSTLIFELELLKFQ